ncbi:formyltransferase family protein [Sphingomonas sp.]|uniref:methionyl-tRNA formyltransferase n=1 Tax=Sphingomonas sp. TaxID=28214 RepID=UPI0031DF1F79
MRALLIGAVEGTRVAANAIAGTPGWDLAAIATLPPELAARHSDFVDLAPVAARHGASLIPVAQCNAPAFLEEMRRIAADIVFVIGWSQICGPEFRAAAGGRVVGYHPAPLPRLRGRAVIPWTILLDEKITASSLFWIDDGIDSGPLLAQRFFHVAPGETAATLYAKHMAVLDAMLRELLPRLARGPVPGDAQDEAVATWATRRRPSDGRIDWRAPAEEIERLVRAVGRPYPGAFSEAGGDRITIWSARACACADRQHASPGQVILHDAEGFAVRCGDGRALHIVEFETAAPRAPALHSVLGAGA